MTVRSFLLLLAAVIVISAFLRQGAAQDTPVNGLEARVTYLEKKIRTLETKIEQGNYRFGEINADVRELRAADSKTRGRLDYMDSVITDILKDSQLRGKPHLMDRESTIGQKDGQ